MGEVATEIRHCSWCGARMTVEDLAPYRDKSGVLDAEAEDGGVCEKCNREMYPDD
ncbi:MAG: hypothetical protein ACYCZN_01480 [Candidatus Dormibacteria bacterium]